jgi:hypothetical protein
MMQYKNHSVLEWALEKYTNFIALEKSKYESASQRGLKKPSRDTEYRVASEVRLTYRNVIESCLNELRTRHAPDEWVPAIQFTELNEFLDEYQNNPPADEESLKELVDKYTKPRVEVVETPELVIPATREEKLIWGPKKDDDT